MLGLQQVMQGALFYEASGLRGASFHCLAAKAIRLCLAPLAWSGQAHRPFPNPLGQQPFFAT